MPPTAYAQNLEDVLLYRALRHVERGFYVDVGANDPVVGSVSNLFYELGWNGINVEPALSWYEQLVAKRPRDTNLRVAAGARAGTTTLFEVPASARSTTRRPVAEGYRQRGIETVDCEVPMLPLTAILERRAETEIHFLKVDVCGGEAEVLEGLGCAMLRPWLICANAVDEVSGVESWREWQAELLRRDYRLCFFDGINRFYLAEEHAELERHFAAPVNAFDGAVRHAEVMLQKKVASLLTELRDATHKVASLSQELVATKDAWTDDKGRLMALISERGECEVLYRKLQQQVALLVARSGIEDVAELRWQLVDAECEVQMLKTELGILGEEPPPPAAAAANGGPGRLRQATRILRTGLAKLASGRGSPRPDDVPEA